LVSASSGDITVEQTIDVALPESDDTPLQEFGVVLDPANAVSQGGLGLWMVLLIVFGLAGAIFAVLVIIKKRMAATSSSGYAAAPPPQVKIVESSNTDHPVHVPTLPELVNEDLAKSKSTGGGQKQEQEPEDMFSQLDHPAKSQKTASHVIKHASKPHEEKPAKAPQPEPKPKPPAPEPKKHEPEKPKPQQHVKPKPHHKDSEIDPKDNSLHIIHDDD
jgi:hypothetical protein